MASRPRRVAVESITDYFDTYSNHFYHKFRPPKGSPIFYLSVLRYALLRPHVALCILLLSNDTIFRALSDSIYKIFSVLDLKNSFSVINQSTLKNKTSHQENETFNIMSNILLE